MPAPEEAIESLANALQRALDDCEFEVGAVEALRLTEGTYQFIVQEHGELPSEPVVNSQ